jgi:hypothetical protein
MTINTDDKNRFQKCNYCIKQSYLCHYVTEMCRVSLYKRSAELSPSIQLASKTTFKVQDTKESPEPGPNQIHM